MGGAPVSGFNEHTPHLSTPSWSFGRRDDRLRERRRVMLVTRRKPEPGTFLCTGRLTDICNDTTTGLPMRHAPIDPQLFVQNRARLKSLLAPNSLVAVNSNDIFPTNADGTLALCPNSDLFYLTGVEQEQTVLLIYPEADDETHREILCLREPTSASETR